MTFTWGYHVRQSASWHRPSRAWGLAPYWRSGISPQCPAGGACGPVQLLAGLPRQTSQHVHSCECHQPSPQHKPSAAVLHHPVPGSPMGSKRKRGHSAFYSNATTLSIYKGFLLSDDWLVHWGPGCHVQTYCVVCVDAGQCSDHGQGQKAVPPSSP